VNHLLETLNEPEINFFHSVSDVFDPEFDLLKNLLALFLELVSHVLVSFEPTHLVVVVQNYLLDMIIILRDLTVPLDLKLKHTLSLFLSNLESGYLPETWLLKSIFNAQKDTSEEGYLNLGSFPGLFYLGIFHYELLPTSVFIELIVALVNLSEESLGGQCGLLIFQLIHKLSQT
jgi:hypothetical protein